MTIEDGIVTLMLTMFVTTVLWLRFRARAQRRADETRDRDLVRTV